MADDLSAKLRDVGTASAWYVMRAMGIHRVIPQGLKAVGTTTPVAGPARTLKLLPIREDMKPFPFAKGRLDKDIIEELNPGDVLVIDNMGITAGGVVGDNHTLRAHKRGAAAIIIDGSCRDADGIRRIGLPVYTVDIHPAGFPDNTFPWEKDVAVQICGVFVAPGDYIIADGDGVIVVPKGLAEQVAAKGADKNYEELYSKSLLREGKRLFDAYPIPESKRGEFEEFRKNYTGAMR